MIDTFLPTTFQTAPVAWRVRPLAPSKIAARQPLKIAPRVSTKLDRNAPCPCNSGRKAKKCCG